MCFSSQRTAQTMSLFKSAATEQKPWKGFLYSPFSFSGDACRVTSESESRLSDVLSPFVPFSVSHRSHLVLLSAFIVFLSAGAGLDRHVGVNLEHRVPGFILEEHSQRTHIFWDTAGLRNPRDDPNSSHYALDGGVVGRSCHLVEFK